MMLPLLNFFFEFKSASNGNLTQLEAAHIFFQVKYRPRKEAAKKNDRADNCLDLVEIQKWLMIVNK